jgi:magnesium-transporting ATPase (P-type)
MQDFPPDGAPRYALSHIYGRRMSIKMYLGIFVVSGVLFWVKLLSIVWFEFWAKKNKSVSHEDNPNSLDGLVDGGRHPHTTTDELADSILIIIILILILILIIVIIIIIHPPIIVINGTRSINIPAAILSIITLIIFLPILIHPT